MQQGFIGHIVVAGHNVKEVSSKTQTEYKLDCFVSLSLKVVNSKIISHISPFERGLKQNSMKLSIGLFCSLALKVITIKITSHISPVECLKCIAYDNPSRPPAHKVNILDVNIFHFISHEKELGRALMLCYNALIFLYDVNKWQWITWERS